MNIGVKLKGERDQVIATLIRGRVGGFDIDSASRAMDVVSVNRVQLRAGFQGLHHCP